MEGTMQSKLVQPGQKIKPSNKLIVATNYCFGPGVWRKHESKWKYPMQLLILNVNNRARTIDQTTQQSADTIRRPASRWRKKTCSSRNCKSSLTKYQHHIHQFCFVSDIVVKIVSDIAVKFTHLQYNCDNNENLNEIHFSQMLLTKISRKNPYLSSFIVTFSKYIGKLYANELRKKYMMKWHRVKLFWDFTSTK